MPFIGWGNAIFKALELKNARVVELGGRVVKLKQFEKSVVRKSKCGLFPFYFDYVTILSIIGEKFHKEYLFTMFLNRQTISIVFTD